MRNEPSHLNIRMELVFHTTSVASQSGPASIHIFKCRYRRWRTSRLPKMSEEGPGESQNTVCICCHAYPCHFCCHIVKPKTRTRTTTTTTTTTRREHRLEAGVGFLQLCTWWLNQKSPFYTVIYSILCLWSMMFWRLLQDVKMQKKKLQFRNICLRFNAFFFPQCSFSRHSSFWRACPKSGCIDAGVQI